MGFLSGSCCPHFDGEAERRPAFHRFLDEGSILSGVALDDGVALHYLDGEIYRSVSSRPQAGAYRLHKEGQEVRETPLPVDYLGED